MSETTRITTIQITTISNKELELLSEEKQRELADTIKILSGADDVKEKRRSRAGIKADGRARG